VFDTVMSIQVPPAAVAAGHSPGGGGHLLSGGRGGGSHKQEQHPAARVINIKQIERQLGTEGGLSILRLVLSSPQLSQPP
jgi:hypothetical protein